jgi:ATP-dependent phosphofructokinase / diphosphate-dependent phosphofructokinase
MPERPFSRDKFLKDVKRVYDECGRCVIAVSEGIVDEDGTAMMAKLTKNVEHDAHGNVQLSGTGMLGDLLCDLIRDKLKIKRVRSDTFGYLQRSFLGYVSDVDQREAREVGERAAHYAIWYNLDGSISIQRTGYYSVNYKLEKLEDVARKTRHMPDNFINADGNGITDDFRYYLRPLLGAGYPTAHRLRAPLVNKLLEN